MKKRIRPAAKLKMPSAVKSKKIDVSPTKEQKKALEKAKKYGVPAPKKPSAKPKKGKK